MHTRLSSHIVRLDEITTAHESSAGAKAFNCARLKQAGFRVPDGLVVLAGATEDERRGLPAHPWFDELPDGALLAVRSSGIGEDGVGQSFAGIHQTFLDVDRAGIGAAVAECLASAHSAQALEYRKAKGISTDAIRMGVLIQRMVRPVASGVAFTVNPLTGAADEIVINASWGIGEALVSGQIDPDELVVGKHDGEERWSRIGDKGGDGRTGGRCLHADQVRELAAILHRIERFYAAPQDVEWCYGDGAFWIVQSRPVTTMPARSATGDETEWTRANIGEVMPDITSPQVLAVFEDLLNRAERQHLGRLIASEETVGPMVKSFHGRLYFNLSQMRHICRVSGVPAAAMMRSMGHPDAIDERDERPAPAPLGARLALIPDFARIVWRHLRAARILREHDARTREVLERLTVPNRRDLADAEVWAVIERWFAEAPDYMQVVLLLGNVMFHEGPVQQACARVGFPFERVAYPLLAAGPRSVSAQQAFDLTALADSARREPKVLDLLAGDTTHISHVRFALRGTPFLAELERFLAKYGHRGRYEYDWSLPRYSEDPTPLLLALRAHVAAEPEAAAAAATRDEHAAAVWREFEAHLSVWQRLTVGPRVRRGLRQIKQYYLWREHVRSDLARVLSALRAWHLVLADRFVERGWLDSRDDYFRLEFGEIAAVLDGRLVSDRLRGIAADRAATVERWSSYSMPLLMRASELSRLIRTPESEAADADPDGDLLGQPVSAGCIEAEVVVVRDPGDFSRMTRGAILVAPATDPSWTPLFTLASGVIVEVGGVLSHASTIAREYGLPAIANVKRATRRLRTGDRVRLDANRGIVQRIRPASTDGEARTLVGANTLT
jgi:pyruvate,water dikinase